MWSEGRIRQSLHERWPALPWARCRVPYMTGHLILKRGRHCGERLRLNVEEVTVSEKPPFCSHQSNNWSGWDYLWMVKLSSHESLDNYRVFSFMVETWPTPSEPKSASPRMKPWRHVLWCMEDKEPTAYGMLLPSMHKLTKQAETAAKPKGILHKTGLCASKVSMSWDTEERWGTIPG